MPLDSGWKLVGWGTPTPFQSASQMFSGEDPGWHNMEKGAEGPTDQDVLESSDAVFKDQHGEYHTVGLAFFDTLDELEEYVDDVLAGEYA